MLPFVSFYFNYMFCLLFKPFFTTFTGTNTKNWTKASGQREKNIVHYLRRRDECLSVTFLLIICWKCIVRLVFYLVFPPFIIEFVIPNSSFKKMKKKKTQNSSFRFHFPGKGRGDSWRMRAAKPGSVGAVGVGKRSPLVFWEKIKMQLHFSNDVVPDSVCSDFQNLNKFTEQVTWVAAHRILYDWCTVVCLFRQTEPNRTSLDPGVRVYFGSLSVLLSLSPAGQHISHPCGRVTVAWQLFVSSIAGRFAT